MKRKLIKISIAFIIVVGILTIFVLADEPELSNILPTDKGKIYTPSTDKISNLDGSYTIKFYTEENHNVYEDGVWKRRMDARSLNNYFDYEIILDEEFPITINNFNSTTVDLTVETTRKESSIPLKVYHYELVNRTECEKFDSAFNCSYKEEKVMDFNENISVSSLLPFQNKKADVTINVEIINKFIEWGFNSTMANFSTFSGDGSVYFYQDCVNTPCWDTAHDSAVGTGNYLGTSFTVEASTNWHDFYEWEHWIYRGFIPVDTSGIPADATITSATMNLYRGSGFQNTYFRLVETTQGWHTLLSTTDYSRCGAVDNPAALADDILINSNGWKVWTLNQTGLDAINKDGEGPYSNGVSRFGIREQQDATDTEPTVSDSRWYSTFRSSEYTGTDYDPYLEVTYTEAGGDTCSPTSPLSANHLFECSDDCTQSTNLEANGYNITINGTGSFLMTANISNVSIGTVLNGCNVTCSGGCII